MKLFIITPYEAMLEAIKNSISCFQDIKIEYGIGDLDKGVELALKAENEGFDSIISRGGTAQMIRKYVNIPVIDMGLSGYDILKTIIIANNQKEKTALIGFSNITSGAYAILDLLDLKTEVYTIESENEVHSLLIQLKEKGFNYIIGDVITTKKASDLNLYSILLQSGEETIKAAIKQAYFVLRHLSQEDYINIPIVKSFRLLNNNYLLFRDEEIIESRLSEFKNNPLNLEQLYTIISESNSSNQIDTFYFEELRLSVDVLSYSYMNEKYKMLLLNPLNTKELNIKGMNKYILNPSYKLVTHSKIMKKIVAKLIELKKEKKIIYLKGDDLFTENTLIKFMYQNVNQQGEIIEVDFDNVDEDKLSKLDWSIIRMINFRNIKSSFQLQYILYIVETHNILSIITSKGKEITDDIFNSHKIIPIKLPNFNERIEDTFEIATHLINYYHNNLGTKPIKINKKTHEEILKKYSFKTMDEYVSLIKEVIFKETNYTISIETVERATENYQNNQKIIFEKTNRTLEELEIDYIEQVVKEEDFNQTSAAERLGISRATLWRKLKKYNIK